MTRRTLPGMTRAGLLVILLAVLLACTGGTTDHEVEFGVTTLDGPDGEVQVTYTDTSGEDRTELVTTPWELNDRYVEDGLVRLRATGQDGVRLQCDIAVTTDGQGGSSADDETCEATYRLGDGPSHPDDEE